MTPVGPPVSAPDITPGMSFDEAARAVLTHLRREVPMAFWSVTRVENGRQTYLHLGENGYDLPQGGSHPWEDSFCIHMAAGTAPPVASDAQAVPAYAAAKVNDDATIGAYAGAVIHEADGGVFGAICGLDPEVGDGRLESAAPLLVLLGQLLSMVLMADRARQRLTEQAMQAELTAETDVLTGLYNRRAWDRLIREEETRFRRFGDPTVLALLDLDMLKAINDTQGHAAGDDHLRLAARVLADNVREGDVVARLGGDEFGVLLRGCREDEASDRVDEVYRAHERAGVAGSFGWAPISVLRGFPAALVEADEAMYAAKRTRRELRSARQISVVDPVAGASLTR